MIPMFEEKSRFPRCHDRRRCFAKSPDKGCKILKDTYANGRCPFCKDKPGNDGIMITDTLSAGKPHSMYKVQKR